MATNSTLRSIFASGLRWDSMSDRATFLTRPALSVLAFLALAPLVAVPVMVILAFSRAPFRDRSSGSNQRLPARSPRGGLPLSRIAPAFREAAVATENKRFYQHGGVDLIALLRAVPFDVTHLSSAATTTRSGGGQRM
jgi:membrane peptidoglycan carboxypeptidase